MKYLQRSIMLLCWLAGWSFTSHGQEPGESNDYQYALIEAVKQKNLGNISEAVKLYTLVIQAKPDCDAAYYELGSIYFLTGQLDLAEEYLSKAYEMIPENQWYTLGYLNALGAQEDYKNAAKILKDKIRTDPEEAEWELSLIHI